MNSNKILELISEKNIEFVQIDVPDLSGLRRNVICHVGHFTESIMEKGFPYRLLGGFQVDGEIIKNSGLGDEVDFAKGILVPDLESFQVLPWLDSTATLFGDHIFDEMKDLANANCRMVCKKQLCKLQEMGYSLYSAFEYEFYLIDNETLAPIYDDNNYSANALHDKVRSLMYDVMRNMQRIGIKPEIFGSEFGPSQQELTMMPDFGIRGMDNAFRFKTLVKNISF